MFILEIFMHTSNGKTFTLVMFSGKKKKIQNFYIHISFFSVSDSRCCSIVCTTKDSERESTWNAKAVSLRLFNAILKCQKEHHTTLLFHIVPFIRFRHLEDNLLNISWKYLDMVWYFISDKQNTFLCTGRY